MHLIIQQTIRCGACGSEQWETFQRAGYVRGTRCLSCKHEKIETGPPAWARVEHGGVFKSEPNVITF